MSVGTVEFDVNRWSELASLLSMDVVRPFYDPMGLKSLPHDRIQSLMQREIVAARKRWAAAPEAGPPLTPELIGDALSRALGANDAERVLWWARHVFSWDTRDNLNLSSWLTLLGWCVNEQDLWKRLFPDDLQDEVRMRFRKSRDDAEYKRIQNEVDARPLSDWDLHIYALRLYDDNLYLDRPITAVQDGPRLYIPTTINQFQGYQFWSWLLRASRPESIDRLWKEGQQIAAQEDLNWIKDLPHPSLLEARL